MSDFPYHLHIEGTRVVYPWDEDACRLADRLIDDATTLGLVAHKRDLVPGEDPDGIQPRNKRWTYLRIGLEDILSTIRSHPGIKFTDLVTHLYFEAPWSDLKEQRAKAKLRTALSRLRTTGTVVKRYDNAGVERWQPAGVATGLMLTPAGPTAQREPETGLPLTLTVDQAEAGAAVLRRLNIFSKETLASDPLAYDDLVRAIVTATRTSREKSL